MRRLFLVAVISAIALARPETYKETEDFQYSRSATDEGTKSGYYGAQRGNVGGNYEKAHNMDSLAQHQMSGAVHQVEGELGDASKTRAGSVYTAANSRGVYGSGRFDLSNLQGRNFAESASSDSSHSSLSSAYNQHSQNSDWRSHAQQHTGSAASDQFGQSSLHSGSLQAGDSSSSINSHRLNSENQYGYSSGYQSQSGYNSQTRYQGESDLAYNQRLSNSHLSSGYGAQAGDQTQSRYTVVTPVRLYGRPGTQVAIPVFAQNYDTHRASAFDQNAINSEAEVLNNNQHHISTVPQNNAKHYESSYNYRKAWERRSESNPSIVPSVAPTVNPYPRNSELYDESQLASGSNSLQQANSHSFSSGNAYNAQSSIAHSGSAQSRHQTDYSSQHKSDLNSNAYTSGTHGSLTGASLGTNVDSQPKSYQSSYSYHKSWERQGDPYVIVPETKTGASSSQRHSSQYRQSNQQHSQGSAYDCDCDEFGNVRAKRSYNDFQYQEDLGQQAQTGWEENVGQQTQQYWGNFQQETQPDQLEDLGQQTQDSWGDFQQKNKPEKLEEPGQQNKPEKLEDFGQQTQQSRGDLQQQSKPEKLEDLGQQSQDWHEVGQQAQQAWDQSEQHLNSQNLEEFGHHDNQQSQQTFDDLQNFGQQSKSKWDFVDSSPLQTQHVLDKPDNFEQQNKPESVEDLGQQTQNKWDDMENLGQQVHTQWDDTNNINKTQHQDTINTEQQIQTQFLDDNQNKQDKELTEDSWNTKHITGYTDSVRNNENSYFNKPIQPGLWGATNDNRHQTSFYNEQHSFNNFNSYLQSHGANWHEQVNRNPLQTSSHNPLQSLWDKIDNLEEQTILSANDRQQFSEGFTGYQNSQHSYYAQGNTNHHESNFEQNSNSFHHNQYVTDTTYQPTATVTFNGTGSTSGKSNNDKDNIGDSFEKPKDKVSTNKLQPTDIGRGDISAEEDSPTEIDIPKKEDDFKTYSTHIKPEKTPEEIEALSLSRGTDDDKIKNINQEDKLSVLSISQQQWLEGQRQQESNDFHKLRGSITTRKPYINENSRTSPEISINSDNFQNPTSSNYDNHKHQQVETESKHDFESTEEMDGQQQFKDFDQQTQNSDAKHSGRTGSQKANKNSYGHELKDLGEQQSTEPQLEDFRQKSQDLGQHNLGLFGNLSQNIDQHTGQVLEDFGQQSQDLNQQSQQQFENLEHQSQHSDQKLEDFGQQTQDLSQQNLNPFENLENHRQNADQHNTGQVLEDFGQQSQDLNQQSQQQFEKFEHQSQHSGQQLEDFGQQTQDLSQQNLNPFENLENHRQNADHHNTGQVLEDFGQQSQDLNQQSQQQFENLEHQSQHSGQKLEDFGQQTQDLNQQNLNPFENLENHRQNADQHNTGQVLEDFGQQSQDLNQQSQQQFENFEHQSQHSGQKLEDFGQQTQDLSQQNLIPFENLENHRQNADHHNTGQVLEDFGQQSQDLNQQSEQQFENLEHQSQHSGQKLEDFGQQTQDLNQQNSESFRNLEHHRQNIDQQNTGQELEDFGQQSQDLNQQSQQQFENFEQQSQNLDQQKAWEQIGDLKPISPIPDAVGKHNHQGREYDPKSNIQEIQEPMITNVGISKSPSVPKNEEETPPPETSTTEIPGFWKSVGSKLSSAKDSVASWFKRS